MRIYMVRHGIALDIGEMGIRHDEERPLSPLGIEKTTRVAQGFRTLGDPPSIIGSSPLVRAWQTALIFRDQLHVAAPVASCEFMAPGGHVTDALQWVNQQSADAVMLVGHMPDIVWMTQACLPTDERFEMHFKKAAVACIVFDNKIGIGKGRLAWFSQPRELRAKAIA